MYKQKAKMKQNKILKGSRGITLIALVITIIVLLILAAVSIATLTGDNGILTKAKTAETTNKEAQAEEEMKLLLADWQLEKRANSSADLGEFLKSKKANGELDKVTDNKDGSYTIEVNGYETTISDEDGLGDIAEVEPPVESLKPGVEATKTEKDNYIDENGDTATIPEGFKVSEKPDEQNVKTGLVVIAPDESKSEFVWVPVPKAIATTSPSEPVADTTEKAMAVKVSEDDYRGLLYDFKGTGTDSYSEVKTGCATTNFTKNRGDAEPVVFEYSNDEMGIYVNDLEKGITLSDLKSEYKKMIDQVEKYKGFYIGRYETSITKDKSNVASKGMTTPMNAADDNQQLWYGMYEKQKNYAKNVKFGKNSEKTLADIVESSMIWGSQWDAVMNWMLTSDTEKVKVTKDSISHGKTTTGASANDVMNKIYDLGNNLYESTLLAFGDHSRVGMGGCGDLNLPPKAHGRIGSPTFGDTQDGSRLALYVK